MLQDIVLHVGKAALGAGVLLLVSYVTETATYLTLKWLEDQVNFRRKSEL